MSGEDSNESGDPSERQTSDLVSAISIMQADIAELRQLLFFVVRVAYTSAGGTLKALNEIKSLVEAGGLEAGQINSLIELASGALLDLQKHLSESGPDAK